MGLVINRLIIDIGDAIGFLNSRMTKFFQTLFPEKGLLEVGSYTPIVSRSTDPSHLMESELY